MKEQKKSECILCSVGCGLIMDTELGEPVNLEYDTGHPANEGTLCSKGNYLLELLNHPMRLTEPRTKGKTTCWKEALSVLAGKLTPYAGSSSIGLVLDGDASVEDVITAQLFAEKCLGTENIAVYFATEDDRVYRALNRIGGSRMLAQPSDVVSSSCTIAVGDPFEVGPVVARKMLKAKYAQKRNVLAAVAGEINRTARFANVRITGNERAMLAALLRAVADKRSNGEPGWLRMVCDRYPVSRNPALEELGKRFVETAGSVLVLETQDPVVAQLAGAIVAAAGADKRIFPLYSYRNTGGICEVYDGRKSLDDITSAVEYGIIKILIVLGADIARGAAGSRIRSARNKLDYLVAGAPFENETTRIADMVLPTALWLECEGTYDGRLLNSVAEAPGGALCYGEILRRLVAVMGTSLPSEKPDVQARHEEDMGEILVALLEEIEKDVDRPQCRSTTLRYADGSITDNVSWIQLQERTSW